MSFPKKLVQVVSHGAFLEKNPDKKAPYGDYDDHAGARRPVLPEDNGRAGTIAPWRLVQSNDRDDPKKYQDDYKFHYNTEKESAMQQLWNKFRNMYSTEQIPDKINIPVIERTTHGSSALFIEHNFDLHLIKSLKDFLVAKNRTHGDGPVSDKKIMGSRSNIPNDMIDAIIDSVQATDEEKLNYKNSLKQKNNIVHEFGDNQFTEEEKKYYRDNNNILGYPYDIRMFFPQTWESRVFNQRDLSGPPPTINTDPDAAAEYIPGPDFNQSFVQHDQHDHALNQPRLPVPPMSWRQQGTNWTHGRSISIIPGPRPKIEKTKKRTNENREGSGDPYRTEVQKGGRVVRLGGTALENNFYTKGNPKGSQGQGKPDYISKDGTKKISLSDYSQTDKPGFKRELKSNALNWGIHELDFNKIETEVSASSQPQGITDIIALLRETIPIDQKAIESISVPQSDQSNYVENVKNILKALINANYGYLIPNSQIEDDAKMRHVKIIKTAIIIGQFNDEEIINGSRKLRWYLNGGPVVFGGNTYDVTYTNPIRDFYNVIRPHLAGEPLIKNNFNIADYIELLLTLSTQINNNGQFEYIVDSSVLDSLFGSMDTNNNDNGNNVLQRIINKLIELEYLEDILLNTVNNTLRNFRENQYIISDKLENSDEQTINNIPLSNWFAHIGEGNDDLRCVRDTEDCLDRWNQFTDAELDRIKQRQNSKVLIHESFSEYKPPQVELNSLRDNRLINKQGDIVNFIDEAGYDSEKNFIKKGKYKIRTGSRRRRYDIDSRFLSIKFKTGSPRSDEQDKNVTPIDLGTEYKFVKGAFVVWLNGTGDSAQAEMGVLMENANSCGVPGTREVNVRKCSNHAPVKKKLNDLYARLYNPDGGIMFLERTQLKTNVNLYDGRYQSPQGLGQDGVLHWQKNKKNSLKAGTSFYTFVPNSFQILDYYVNVERTWPIISSNVCRDPVHTTPYYMNQLIETPDVEGVNCYNDLWRETNYGVMKKIKNLTTLGPSWNRSFSDSQGQERNADVNNDQYCMQNKRTTNRTPESFKSEIYKKFPVTQLYFASHAVKSRAYWKNKEARNVGNLSGIAAGDRVSRISQDQRERILGSEYIGEMTLDQRNAADFREAEQRD